MVPINLRRQVHIDQLAKNLNCTLIQRDNLPGMMYVEFGYVEGPTIKDQITYLTMLHELGHIEHGHTQGRPPATEKKHYFTNGVLRSEAEAWDWALRECSEKIEDSSRRFMWDFCLGSYYRGYLAAQGRPSRLGNGGRYHVEFTYDDPDHFFRETVRKIQGDLEDFLVPFKWHGF